MIQNSFKLWFLPTNHSQQPPTHLYPHVSTVGPRSLLPANRMRRFQSTTMTSKLKPYEMVGRPVIHSHGPPSSLSPSSLFLQKSRLIKLVAAMIVAILALYFVHGILTPSDRVYGLMIDAGSTGSRIHTYTMRKHPQSGTLKVIHDDFFPLKPGLSHYKDNPQEAAKSLLPLLQRAKTRVPRAMQLHTPILLRATAGLRMTGEAKAQAILKEVRSMLRGSGFRFDSDEWAAILSGNEEAVYSWMTVNYLLGREASNTVGTLEMGGGSAQIAYVPRDGQTLKKEGECNVTSEPLTFGGREIDLYATSHLDFGLQKARALILKRFKDGHKLSDNPCFNSGRDVEVQIPFENPALNVTFLGQGDYQACQDLIIQMFFDPSMKECKCSTCTYRGAAQPQAINEYVALAFYLERTVSIGMPSEIQVSDIDAKGKDVCSLSAKELENKLPSIPNGNPTDLCLDLAYISLHLQRGHGIMPNSGTKLRVANKIDDFELGWCLGAMQQTMDKLNMAA